MQDIQTEMRAGAAPLELDTIDESSILAAEELIDEEERRLQEWSRLSEALDSARQATKQWQTRVESPPLLSTLLVNNVTRRRVTGRTGW